MPTYIIYKYNIDSIMFKQINRSRDTKYKYEAILEHQNGIQSIIPFGNMIDRHYADTTPLGCYKQSDTYNNTIRENAIKKFLHNRTTLIKNSSKYFELKYLYSVHI